MSAELAELIRSFGGSEPPAAVWQAQFDGDDAALKRLSYARPGDAVRMPDLHSYIDDLLYVEELQEGLLLRVLPHALHAWRGLLLKGRPAALSEHLHAGLAKRRDFIARVLGPEGSRGAETYMARALLELMSREDSLNHRGEGASPYVWSGEFVSFGRAWEGLDLILEPWRRVESPGLALCAAQYLSGLVYDGADNPVFPPWTGDAGGGPIAPWEGASGGFDERWSDASAERLRALLTGGGAAAWLADAAKALKGHPQAGIAAKVAADAVSRSARVETRVGELCRFLSTPNGTEPFDWAR